MGSEAEDTVGDLPSSMEPLDSNHLPAPSNQSPPSDSLLSAGDLKKCDDTQETPLTSNDLKSSSIAGVFLRPSDPDGKLTAHITCLSPPETTKCQRGL